jgi:hypothetical protein
MNNFLDMFMQMMGQQPQGMHFNPNVQLDPSQVEDRRWERFWPQTLGPMNSGNTAQWYYDPIQQWMRQ